MSTTSDRVLFVDLARAAAVLFMIQGHTLQVLLGAEHQPGTLFDGWLYLRGLTSCAFLMLSGFSFSVATDRHWADYRAATPRLRRRLVRFGGFLLLGYAMRIPVRPLSNIWRVTADQWQTFAVVDILHLVAVTLTALQVLVWLTGTRRRLAVWALGSAAAIVLLTPLAWGVDWRPLAPVFLASYLSSATGSLFPLFPWAAYILFGAVLGVWFVTRSERQRTGRQRTQGVSRVFAMAGVALVAVGVLLHLVPFGPYGPIDFWKTSPNLFLVKAGSVLLLLAAATRVVRSRTALPRVVSVLSRESLTIYFVHVCILYGSVWNDGLMQIVGPHLGLLATIGWIVFLMASMSLLAWLWHECKHWSGRLSTLVRAAAAVALVHAIT